MQNTVVFIELNDDKIRTRSSRIEVVDKLFINSFLSHLCIVQHEFEMKIFPQIIAKAPLV